MERFSYFDFLVGRVQNNVMMLAAIAEYKRRSGLFENQTKIIIDTSKLRQFVHGFGNIQNDTLELMPFLFFVEWDDGSLYYAKITTAEVDTFPTRLFNASTNKGAKDTTCWISEIPLDRFKRVETK